MAHELEDVMNIEDVIAFSSEAESMFCERLDELIEENALVAALDGTLATKLVPSMLDEDTLELLRGAIFVEEELSLTDNLPAIILDLSHALWGVAQYFRFCQKPITASWGTDMAEGWIPEHIQMLPETEYAAWVLREGRSQGMTEEEIFAVMGFLCIGENGKVLQ